MLIASTELTVPQLRAINVLLFGTYPTYRDRASRLEVQRCLSALWEQSALTLEDFVTFFRSESLKGGLASSNLLVLIEWASLVIQECSKTAESWEKYGFQVLLAHSQLLDLLSSLQAKPGTKRSALVVTRRAVRRLFRNELLGDESVERTVNQLAAKGPLCQKNAVMLGVVAGVCARLDQQQKSRQEEDASRPPRAILESLKQQYYAFWTREVISSKNPVPKHVANAFHDFFENFATIEEMKTEIIPALEKALLRAPEVVLNDLVSPLINSIHVKYDFSEVLANHLLKPLLSALKSSNADIRDGSLRAFRVLLARCREDDSLDLIMNEFLKPLMTSKVPTADQRVVYSKILQLLPTSSSRASQICTGLSNVARKEPNEAALAAEASALTAHIPVMASGESPEADNILKVYSGGLRDKKPTIQKIWAMNLAQLLWVIKDKKQSFFSSPAIEEALQRLFELFNDITVNPMPAAQSGLIVIAYILCSLQTALEESPNTKVTALLAQADPIGQALVFEPKPSFLLNHKAYSKATGEEEIDWLIRAIAACTSRAIHLDPQSATTTAWIQAWIYTITAFSINFQARQSSVKLLSRHYQQAPAALSKIVVQGLWEWLNSLHTNVKDAPSSLAQIGASRLDLVLNAVCLPSRVQNGSTEANHNNVYENELVDLLVLTRPEIIPRSSWIDVCLEMGQDPGSIATSKPQECIQKVNSILIANYSSKQPVKLFEVAAYNACADLAFVAPDAIIPLLDRQIQEDLDLEEFHIFTPQDFAIARTPEGSTFVDVVNKKGPTEALDKGSSDYEILKWEAEVRAQQASKRGQQKKLTADEQAKIDAQLVKESHVRERVRKLEHRLRRAIGIIKALALGPPTEASKWIGPALGALLQIIQAGAGLLVGESAGEAFVACANLVTNRLGALRQFVGVATLRSLGSSHIPDYLQQESLGGMTASFQEILADHSRSCNSSSLPITHRRGAAVVRRSLAQLHATSSPSCNKQTWRSRQRRGSSR